MFVITEVFSELSPVDEMKERHSSMSRLSRRNMQKSASTTSLTLMIKPNGKSDYLSDTHD